MNQSVKHVVKYRKDYSVPTHSIDAIDLYVKLEEEKTIVTAKSHLRADPKSKNKDQLVLNGEEQVLKYIMINNKELSSDQYELTKESLILKGIPDEFDLEIQSEIKPQENTSLMGLYKSKDMFCTQCEPSGFRKITYFLDRPDVLAKYTTTIVADKKRYPVLLSNGNLIGSGDLENGMHWVKWEDPFKKPSYLFALVAGDLDYIEDYFITMSGRKVTLQIFCEKGYQDQSAFAMSSLKKAMKWDEEKYGREYDLNLFMIVAVSDFNHGAMENKGLNIFNSKYVFAKPRTATDRDYESIDAVVAHEYFHNWTGDRIACRDWFQLSLKEGLTVFRDQTFSENIGSQAVQRIDQVCRLRTFQFSEDCGPLAHPVRPDSYIEMDNFYTTTVYEKGAEVIRMMRAILGEESFYRGMDLYFDRFDGMAVTCDDFVGVMEEAGKVDLTQFKLWYSQAGTPELHVTSEYNVDKKQYKLNIKQVCPKTPGQDKKLPMHIPLKIGLGVRPSVNGSDPFDVSRVLNITKEEQSFVFENISEKPILSLLRDFSAPVKIFYNYSDEELAFLMANDSDDFARFEAGQIYMMRVLFDLIKRWRAKEGLELPDNFVLAFKNVLLDDKADRAFVAEMIFLPSEVYLADQMDKVDVEGIHEAREFMIKSLAKKLKLEFEEVYRSNLIEGDYKFQIEDVAKRSLKNACLGYLTKLVDGVSCELAMRQFKGANNMTDQFVALNALINTECIEREEALRSFYEQWKHEPLVVDKWFSVQAVSFLPGSLDNIKRLLGHPDFDIKNPNKVYALIRTFSLLNPICFHDKSGDGYRLLADQILILNKINPNVAALLAKAFAKWRRFDDERKGLMKEQLDRILNESDLSKNVYEIVINTIGVRPRFSGSDPLMCGGV